MRISFHVQLVPCRSKLPTHSYADRRLRPEGGAMTAPVPDCLLHYADLAAWVGWHFVRVNGEPRKVPLNPRTGTNASVADPRTWGTLAAAQRLATLRALPGVGIVSAAVAPLAFFDFDRCLDPATGEPINGDAARLLEACADTFCEITPSGRGLRVIGTAPAIAASVSRKGTTPGGLALEIYNAAPRYLTVTGRRFGDHPDTLADIGDVVLDVLPLLGTVAGAEGDGDGREDAELVRRIATGEGFHAELCALAARYTGRGISAAATAETLRGLMLAQPQAARDDRWRDRFESIGGLVASAAGKYAETAEHRRALAKLAGRLLRDRRPSAEMRAAVLAEAAARGIEPERAEAIARWVVEREIERRGATRG
jgi:hypothetical protein